MRISLNSFRKNVVGTERVGKLRGQYVWYLYFMSELERDHLNMIRLPSYVLCMISTYV